ncbi:drug efflux protein, partial [gut metagenome]
MVLSYDIHADMDPANIQYYVERNIRPYLNQIDYVREVNVSGATPLYLDIEYHPVKLQHYGLDAGAIHNGVARFLGQRSIVGDVERTNRTGERKRISLLLETPPLDADIGRIPLTTVGGRIIYLSEVATFHYKEQPLANFYRINGMNTVNLSIYVDADENIITASSALRERMERIQQQLDEGCYVELTSDEAKKVREELKKLVSRTFLSLLFLFVFVWISSRSGRYLSVIAVSLIANVLLAVIFFYLFGIELNIISLAGMAVSFGIMIDTTIVMVDHYSYYRNRNVFLAILAALLTTVGSLMIVFFMPEYVKSTLNDFAAIIIVNLVVALLVALLFVPALIERFQLQRHQLAKSRKYYRRVAGWTAFYTRYISFTQKHKWVYVLLLIWAFGLPVQWLPERIGYSWYEYLAKGRP